MALQVVMCLLAVVGLEVVCLEVPPGLQFGVATAAYQVEGAWNVSDKGESIWDRLTHSRPDAVTDRGNGDVACDSYHHLEEDLEMLDDLGVDFYRFSISWPRLLPTGFTNKISADGRRYYSKLLAGLRARRIAPIVTLNHFDLPQRLQDLGGWTNPLIVDWFGDYARVVFSLFGDQVNTWITINEPVTQCDVGYNGAMAPGYNDYEMGVLLCTKYILLAHAKAYRIYEKEFKPKYGGQVSIANQEFWYEPKTDEDAEITILAREYSFGRYTHPIYSAEGGWPPTLEAYMAEKSKLEGHPRSRLPAFTREEIKLLKGSFDFFALNHYTSRTVRSALPGEKVAPFLFSDGLKDVGAVVGGRDHWSTARDWLKVNPEGIRNNLRQLKQEYGDIRIMITENGYSDNGELDDTGRIEYYRKYLEQVLLAIYEDGVNVFGYTAWSLMDNFEWASGYTSKFGIYDVDFSDPERKRRPRKSALFYRDYARALWTSPTHGLRMSCKKGCIKSHYKFYNLILVPSLAILCV